MRSAVLNFAIALVVFGVFACNDPLQSNSGYPSGGPGGPVVVPVAGVRVTPQTIVLTAVGDTRQLAATIAPLDATDRALAWESSDSSVATVNAAGLVTAKRAGAGIFITVFTHDGHFQSSANVTVGP